MAIEKETPAIMIIIAIVLVIVTIGLINNFRGLRDSFVNLIFGNETTTELQPQKSEIKNKTYIADNFLAEFESCVKSQDTDCYCPFANTFMPEGMHLVFRNDQKSKKATFNIYSSDADDACDESGLPVKQPKELGNVELYVEDTLGKPDVKSNKLDHTDFSKATNIYFAGSQLCSAKDVWGSNDISFKEGIVYKIDKSKIAFTRKQEGLRRCQPA